jgi:peptidoglycan endopeptidase LytF
MDNYQRYELKKLNPHSEEYTIVLYLADHLSEFANELGTLPKDRKDVVALAKQIIKERYSNIKVTMVKVIIGGMAVTSIPIMGSKSSTAQAAETTNFTPHYYGRHLK